MSSRRDEVPAHASIVDGSPGAEATDETAQTLRARAEDLARTHSADLIDPESMSPAALRDVLHELSVHQIELGMQNEELRQAQRELEASRERYFDLYDLAPVAYFTLSARGLVEEANLTAATLLGVPRGTLVGQAFTHAILPADQDIYYHYRQQLKATDEPQVCELRMRRADGSIFHARLETTPARHASDALSSRTVVSDISEHKHAELARLQLERKLQQIQREESLGRMAGAIAHQFNNLLTAVIANAELARDAVSPRSEVYENLTEILNAAHSAADVSGLMLLTAGQSFRVRAPLDLADRCRRSLTELRAAMPPHVSLNPNLPASGPVIEADATEVHRVLNALVTNGWEAVPGGPGTVRVTVGTVAAADIPTLHRFPAGWRPLAACYAVLEVMDDGHGIPESDLDRIFEPFFSTKRPGRGLGLAVVQGIVSALGGAITADSQLGRGTTLRVYLPVRPEADLPARPEPVSRAHAPPRQGIVLLVDDEPAVRRASAATLTRLGYRVLTADDGAAAVALFEQRHEEIGCVLCDVTMPGLDGWETAAALRRISPTVHVVLTSGYDQEYILAHHAGASQPFLQKPYNVHSLRAAIGYPPDER